MRVTYAIIVVALLAALSGPSAGAAEREPRLAKALRDAVEGALAAYDREDRAGFLAFVHTKSPAYDALAKEIDEDFARQDVSLELVRFWYVGHDQEEFAVARVKMKTTGDPRHDFRDNVVDSMQIFHQENGAWKFWGEHILGVEFLD